MQILKSNPQYVSKDYQAKQLWGKKLQKSAQLLFKMEEMKKAVKEAKEKILGPVNAPLFRLNRKFRIRFLIRGLKSMKLQSSLAKIIPKFKFSSGIKLSVDVDPINFN